ncbi:MAG: FAD-binding oxidoreductase, partial [Flavobacteriales bacterium]|nr:FAD-binding oxidoreductase [Flavobacteriales bacterium]
SAVAAIFNAGIIPSAMELMERDAILWGKRFINDTAIVIEDNTEAHLLIEVDGNDIEVLYKDCELIYQVLENFKTGEILFADDSTQKEKLWKIRRVMGEAVKSQSIYKEEDTVVPRAELPKLLKGVKEIGAKYGFKSVCYGHAGDGNLHVNIIKDNMSDEAWNNELPQGIAEIFLLCVQLKGTISGEHGIGYVQKLYMNIPFGEKMLSLQKQIKSVFDPNNILNPSKMFP